MGYSIGYDSKWKRDIGYGVPAVCDHPDCNEKIDRGLAYVCGGEPYGGVHGCGLFFCSSHLYYNTKRKELVQLCDVCSSRKKKLFKPKPDLLEWIQHKMSHESWETWRKNAEERDAAMRQLPTGSPVRMLNDPDEFAQPVGTCGDTLEPVDERGCVEVKWHTGEQSVVHIKYIEVYK